MIADQGASTATGLAQLVDVLSQRLQAGEALDLTAELRAHPEYADQLRRLLPALGALNDLAPNGDGSSLATPSREPLGDFRLVREVGRGGMGVVYEAEQISLRRRVALKVLPFAATLDSRQLQRFRHEAQAAALLHHPNIVPVYAVGCERSVHYYAMQFIGGRTLSEAIRELRSSPPMRPAVSAASTARGTGGLTPCPAVSEEHCRAAARLTVQAADALEYAHQTGVVHRDVKPANLLLDDRGELWVTDFGLALVRGHPELTVTGDLLGTLRYMSPEQAQAKPGVVDHRTDIYSLGATLYELLTLEPAVPGDDRATVLQRIAHEDAIPLRRHNSAVPADLETVVLKAMARSRDERYLTSREFADDLRRFLDGRPISARRVTRLQRAQKWAARHRRLLKTLTVAAWLTFLAVVIGSLVYARHEREAAAASKRQAEELSRRLRDAQRAERDALRAERAARLEIQRLRLLRAQDARKSGQPDSQQFYIQDLSHAAGGKRPEFTDEDELDTLYRHDYQLHLAAVRRELLTGLGARPDGPFRDVVARSRLDGHAGCILALAFSPNHQRLASAATDHTVRLWDIRGLKHIRTLALGEEMPGALAFSPDGKYLAVGDHKGGVRLFDVETGAELSNGRALGGKILRLQFSPDGQRVFAAAYKSGLAAWDLPRLKPVPMEKLPKNVEEVIDLAIHPDGELLVYSTPKFELYRRAPGGGHDRLLLTRCLGFAGSLGFDEKGEHLTLLHGNGLAVLDWRTGKGLETVPTWRITHAPNGQWAAAARDNRAVSVCNRLSGKVIFTLPPEAAEISSMTWSPGRRRLLAVGQSDGGIALWDIDIVDARFRALSLDAQEDVITAQVSFQVDPPPRAP